MFFPAASPFPAKCNTKNALTLGADTRLNEMQINAVSGEMLFLGIIVKAQKNDRKRKMGMGMGRNFKDGCSMFRPVGSLPTPKGEVGGHCDRRL